MTYSPEELIRHNLAELRKHMLHQGCTEAQWQGGLCHELRRLPTDEPSAALQKATQEVETFPAHGARRVGIRLAAAAGDVAHAIRTLAETPLTAGQITIAVMEKRREIANAPAIEGET